MINNTQFLQAVFGEDHVFAHVTDFKYPPDAIPDDRHLAAWAGDYFGRYRFNEPSNQYFTISTFYADEQNKARRRKALYRATHCIVLDDVREKLPIEQVNKLPQPAWILETSAGSEQWGYILPTPETDRARVENLLDGLVANGLAPQGKDPGMKGVTRYVRLPDGVNNKTNKLVNGEPFNCRMLLWEPLRRTTLEELAAPFFVDLNAVRREQRVDGAAEVSDHPLLQIPDLIHIKEVRSDGRYDITCPWVEGHTHGVDNGAGMFTNSDGSMGFKCHHGSCQHRTGADLMRWLEEHKPGFTNDYRQWQARRAFSDVAQPFTLNPPPEAPDFASFAPVVNNVVVATEDAYKAELAEIRRMVPGAEQRARVSQFLRLVDQLDKMSQKEYHAELCDVMRWSKQDFKDILKSLREEWFHDRQQNPPDFAANMVFVGEINRFYDREKRIYYTPEAYGNFFLDQDEEARKNALTGHVTKVDKLDFAPEMPSVFEERGVTYANIWQHGQLRQAVAGDCSPWLNHFSTLGFSASEIKHCLQWMAYTIRFPGSKINHILLFASGEGAGKDLLLYPLKWALDRDAGTIHGEMLLKDFNGWLFAKKFIHIDETELGDYKEAERVTNRLKPIAAAPPLTLSVNVKNVPEFDVRNIVNCIMTSNSKLPLRQRQMSRRYFALWSDFNPRDESGQMKPEWSQWFSDVYRWMENGGAAACLHYLMHEVDLSDFDPGASPAVTDFLQDIIESSQTPMEKTIKNFIHARIGNFAADVVRAEDLTATLRGAQLHPDPTVNTLMEVDVSQCTTTRIGRVLGQIQGCRQIRIRHGHSQQRFWIIRNQDQWANCSHEHILSEYERTVQAGNTAEVKQHPTQSIKIVK